jgi:hypothetical protein
MNQLITQPTSPAIAAYEGTRCAQMAQQELLPEIVSLYKMVCAYSGQQVTTDPQSLNMVARMIENDLRQTKCTIEEFKIAVQEGMKTTEPYSANAPRTYMKWLQEYMDKVRMEIAAYRRLKQAEPKPEPTEDEKMRNAIEHILSMYDKWKAGHEFVDGGSAGYLWLESVGEIQLTIDEKVEQFEASRERAIKAIQARKEDSTKFEARSIDRLLLDIESRPNDIPELKFEQVKICRNDLLKQYFMANELTFDYLKEHYEAVQK